MATKKKTDAPVKMTIAQTREALAQLQEEHAHFKEGAYCYMCDKHKPKDRFYQSTDPMIKSELTPICKDCAKAIALRKDKNGKFHEATKDSVQKALYYLNKPFLDSVWVSSIQEVDSGTKENVWASYIKNISMINYIGLTYKDSDMFREKIIYEDEKTVADVVKGREDQDTYSDFEKNRNDVVRLIGYDPFEHEVLSDQPFLYSQLLGILDSSEDANDDMMRTASAISIVRGFLQLSKIDDEIVKMMSNPSGIQKNSSTFKQLQESKRALNAVIKDLAAESCISLKNNKNTKKGENTWTGKIKKIKDMNLREGEVNGFDIATCKAMRQVMDMSNASILKQLRLDESEYSEMIAEQREMITKLQGDLEAYKEISRILLRENIDLKDYMEEHGYVLPVEDLVNLNDLFSRFSAEDEEDSDVGEDENIEDLEGMGKLESIEELEDNSNE